MDDAARVIEALKHKDLRALETLLKEDAKRADACTPEGLSALQLACYLRFSQGVDALLRAGASPDVFAAATLGDTARVRALVAQDRRLLEAHGADGGAPLHLAAHFGHVETVRTLLSLGAGVDSFSGGMFNNTALHAASAGSQGEVVELLLAAGAKPDLPDKNGYRPLHVAAANGAVRAVKALLAKGADPKAGSPQGTALDFARSRGMDEVAALLSGA
jgi:ankyrin repeat protein